MRMQRLPLLTLSLVAVLVALHVLLPDRSMLWFSARYISSGEYWRFFTGHLVHADTAHLLWNCLGLAVLGYLLEQHSRRLLGFALVAGTVAVGMLLLSPLAELDYYCGLSGVLNTLLLVALWIEWARTRSWMILLIAGGCLAKTAIEVSVGESVLTHISWPPYAWAHVAGLAGGLLLIWTLCQFRFRVM